MDEVRRKQKVGRVVSNKMEKTVVVAVDYRKPHPIYRKTVRQTNKFYVHDETNECKIGDVVRIEETRPLSKLKRWRIIEIVGAGRTPMGEAFIPTELQQGEAEE
jgi:small subunit ribosomal protein S17